jgi:hypothetical protein
MPDPSRKRPPTKPHPSRVRSAVSSLADFVGSIACLVLCWHATVSTVPRVQGQGRPPGQATGRTKAEHA